MNADPYKIEIEPIDEENTKCRLRQTARFKPRGLLGLAYWYAVLPLHGFVFRGMLLGIQAVENSWGGRLLALAYLPAIIRAWTGWASLSSQLPSLRRVGILETIYTVWFAVAMAAALQHLGQSAAP